MTIKEILDSTRSIAVVGFSVNPNRPSNSIAYYLQSRGYIVYGVNPGLAGKNLEGIDCFASISEIPAPIDLVNIFRRSEFVPAIVNEALSHPSKPKFIWTQFNVISSEAEKIAVKNGLEYIQDRCIYIEHRKLNAA